MLIIIYDFGTSSVKSCLFEIGSTIELVAVSSGTYGLFASDDGGVEQDSDEWWDALCTTTREVLQKSGITADRIDGLSFCSQMQGTVLVDREGKAVRRPMNYLDQRGIKEYQEGMVKGLIKVSGVNLVKLARNVLVNYAGSVSAKDPVWKYKWVENNEPDVFKRVYKWLDIGDYLLARTTGRIVRTADSAFATFIYDTRKGREGWNKGLLKMYKVHPEHMPEIIACTDLVGPLTKVAADELGLRESIPVFGGGGDTTFVNIGAGCTRAGDTHIYVGTSGWVSTYLDYQTVDVNAMITGVLSAVPGYFNYYAELETAGKCFDWALDHLVLDEVGVYVDHNTVDTVEGGPKSVYDHLTDVVEAVPAGANGVIFTPWLHGNRCPFEDSEAGGMFFNLRIDNDKSDMIRAVLEGICYHLRWLLECQARKVKTSDPIRFVGGGSKSTATCQMLADICGRTVETVDNTQEVGAMGAALVVAAGVMGTDVRDLAHELVIPNHAYVPNPANKAVYERNYQLFRRLYKSNAKNFHLLNSPKGNGRRA